MLLWCLGEKGLHAVAEWVGRSSKRTWFCTDPWVSVLSRVSSAELHAYGDW